MNRRPARPPRLTALARHVRRRELRALARLARRRGQSAWIVGGVLRDLLAGLPAAETDLAVDGDAGTLAREMEAAGFGTMVPLSTEAPRVFRVAGKRPLDIAELTGGSIESDLARRDFTVNAMACDLRGADWRDPFHGAADLARGRLRLVREGNLLEDPLRILRGARLFATHGLCPDARLTAAACRAAASLSDAAPERRRAEIVKLLEARQVGRPLQWLLRVGALGPALDLPAPVLAGPLLRPLDSPALSRRPAGERPRLRLVMLAMGLGLSPAGASAWLRQLRFGREEAGNVAALLELVRRALETSTPAQRWAWIRDAGPRRGEAVLLLRHFFPRRAALAASLSRRVSRKIPISGSDVMQWLDIPPGPDVGRALREIEIEAMRGRVRGRRQARRWLADHRERVVGRPSGLDP